ncbi:Uncharacterised protein [Bordetella pertussis]|nr:Uncharacterised protein [Bordetella pertussis]CFO29866.1 Uncharacterised protein [Bordetella pertussis]CFO95964.1 Uncharacterised protein [Bordetella pertussis]CFT96864.1 Uncharacterised protein [Bordetella pertussis]CPI92659.1 Uncharacterised protein [Bordetella pertussis]
MTRRGKRARSAGPRRSSFASEDGARLQMKASAVSSRASSAARSAATRRSSTWLRLPVLKLRA